MEIGTRTTITVLGATVVVAAVVLLWFWGGASHTVGVSDIAGSSTKTLEIAGARVVAEVVSTPAARERGLSGRAALPQGRGMLFDMGGVAAWGFWMKDMNFAIDIVWLADDGTIVSVAANVEPDSYPEVFTPSSPARYVLELPAGYMAALGVGVGEKVVLYDSVI